MNHVVTNWGHGYYNRHSYICTYIPQLAPNWLDFSALLAGHAPARSHEGERFRYLELGSGMGFGLCLLAAVYPEGEFIGVDFHPDHIAHSRWLADHYKLTNIRFLEADFLDLNADPSPLGFESGGPGCFQYVNAHGILTWVGEQVQQSLISLASLALAKNGIFYCSYNTLPGWLDLTLFHHLVQLERQRSDPGNSLDALVRARKTLQGLLGSTENKHRLGQKHPFLSTELENIEGEDPLYLLGEYANDCWRPLHVAEMHRKCAEHKLSPIGSANLPDHFEELLADHLKPMVANETDPLIRQTLLDLATNKYFRRDLFVRGVHRLPQQEREKLLGKVKLRLLKRIPRKDYHITSDYGTIRMNPESVASFASAFNDGVQSIEQLLQFTNKPFDELLRLICLILHDGRLGLDRGALSNQAAADCQVINSQILDLILQGRPYAYLAVPVIGTGIHINGEEACLIQAMQHHLEDESLLRSALDSFETMGGVLYGSEGQTLTDSIDKIQAMSATLKHLRTIKIPRLQALGALGA